MTLAWLSSQIVTAAVVCVMLLSGTLLDPAVFLKQFNPASMKEFANLAFASCILIPAIVIALLWLAPLAPMVKLVVITLAMLPCAPVIPAMAALCDEPAEWALFVLIAMSMLNLAALPVLLIVLRLPWLAGEAASIDGEQMLGILKFLGITYVPMVCGLALRYIVPQYLPQIVGFLRRTMGKFLIASFVFYMAAHYRDLLELGLREFVALIGMEAVCVSVALLFVRSPANHRVTAMLSCTMRNFAMAIAFTTSEFAKTTAPVTMLAFTTILFWLVTVSLGVYRRSTSTRRAANST